MDAKKNTTAACEDKAPGISEAIDAFDKARHLVELLFLAGEGMSDRDIKQAIATGCDVINDTLLEGLSALHTIHDAQRAGKAGAQ